jgi:hypothetical protein
VMITICRYIPYDVTCACHDCTTICSRECGLLRFNETDMPVVHGPPNVTRMVLRVASRHKARARDLKLPPRRR